MQISADATLPFPREIVFRTYRDHLLDLVEFLPNIRRIEEMSREQNGPKTEILNIWHGGGEVPAAARAVISENMLSWSDYASWDEADFSCSWRIETHAFTDAVNCRGKNRFVVEDDRTRLEIRGDLSIDAKKIRAVPKLLSGTVSRAVEDFLMKKITPNLVSVSDGLQKYLEREK